VVTDEDPELELCEPLDEELLEDEPLDEEPSDEELFRAESSEEDPLVEESSEDESSDDPLAPEDPLDEDPLSVVLVVDEPFDAFVVVAAEVEPRFPVAAITPKASAKVASAAAVIRRRIILMRWARAARRWRTRSGFEAGGGVEGMPAS
jgi:hypothetical protein